MSKLIVSTQNDSFVVTGDVSLVAKNRMAKMYMRNNLPCDFSESSFTLIKPMDVSEFMKHLQVVANYAKCEIVFGDDINEEIDSYQERERQFAEFSRCACDIRNNHPVVSDFKAFEESLIQNMPNRSLYQLQMLSAYHMAFAQNACNFSVPGAGKTSVVYGAYAFLRSLPKADPKHVDKILIIGPLSSFGPWESEFEECFGRSANAVRLSGGLTKEKKYLYLYSNDTEEVTLTSYQSVASIKEGLQFFLKNNKVMLVLDEAHKIKNSQGAITAVSTLELAEYAKSRVVLTGTPAPNGYEDLHNLFKFIWPDRKIITFNVGNLEDMSKRIDDSRVPILIDEISPFFIRVKKSDLGIPPAVSQIIPVEMSDAQRRVYDAIERRIIDTLESTDDSPFLRRVRRARLIRLQQVATNPMLLRSALYNMSEYGDDACEESEEDKMFLDDIRHFVSDEIPQKFIIAANLAEEIIRKGGKVVIWANFINNIEQLHDYLESRGISSRMLYGATPVEGDNESDNETREKIVKEFNSDNSSFNAIIANPFAVAESISLHKKCHNAIYIERSFNAAHFIQSKDRIHRYGLPAGTETRYFYLISKDSVDETISERLAIKESRLNEIMESMPIPLFKNVDEVGGLEDIKAILRDYAARSKKI